MDFYWNDVWRSTDQGATWTLITARAEWSARSDMSSVVLSDGSIVLMGGSNSHGKMNDVWRSTDQGTTWKLITARAEWSARSDMSSVVLSDGSIVLMGGDDNKHGYLNDTWRSTDNGTTWNLVNTSSGWSGRVSHNTVIMPDGSIILLGGFDIGPRNDVWKSTDKGATWTQITAGTG